MSSKGRKKAISESELSKAESKTMKESTSDSRLTSEAEKEIKVRMYIYRYIYTSQPNLSTAFFTIKHVHF